MNAQHDWNAAHAAGGHYFANAWTGISHLVNDAGLWAVIASGTVGIFVMLVTVEADDAEAKRVSASSTTVIGFLVCVVGLMLLTLPATAGGDRLHTMTRIAARSLNFLGIAIATCFWPIGRDYAGRLARSLERTEPDTPLTPHLHSAGLLASAVIAGPVTAALAFALWRIVNAAGDGVPLDGVFYRDTLLGEGLIALASLPGLLLHRNLLRVLGDSVRFRVRWLHFARYFGLVFFFGIPLTAPLIHVQPAARTIRPSEESSCP